MSKKFDDMTTEERLKAWDDSNFGKYLDSINRRIVEKYGSGDHRPVKIETLPGGLGEVVIGSTGKAYQITKAESTDNGSVTITLAGTRTDTPATEDAEFEVVEPKRLPAPESNNDGK